MIITFKDIKNLTFPLYVLPSDNWQYVDRVLFLDNFAIDDKSVPGKTLGIRRIQCGRKDLLPLKLAVLNINQLLRAKQKHFIDSKGKPFTYVKTKMVPLKTHKIKRIEKKEVASLLWVHGISHPFTLERPPLNNPEYVRFLYYNGVPWIIYDYIRIPTKDTYRRV